MIHCQNVVKTYEKKKVLNGIKLDIPKGQIFGLLGPSGAGKTTLIKILTGQLSYEEGSVAILGKQVEELTGRDKKKIGIMMEQFGVYERLSCADNLKLFADIYGIPHSRVKEILEEAAVLCDKVALLNEGRIIESGNPKEVCRKYNHQKTIILHLANGEDLILPHGIESAEPIAKLIQENQIETIHSSEPTLETVFLELTGRKLEEDE